MKKVINCVIIALLFWNNVTHSQTGYDVDKDYRIAKYEKSIIYYLIKRQQFDVNKTPFKISDYQGKIYIRKCLEVYNDLHGDFLLVKFGSLGDHTDVYWGLLKIDKSFYFNKMMDLEVEKVPKSIDKRTMEVIAAYINQTPI